jgi:hypothetical protein
MSNKQSPYTYLSLTVSVCPTCHVSIPASLKEKDGRIYMSKSCAKHGRFLTLVASDAEWYKRAQSERSPSLMLRQYQTKTGAGCPQDCGVCPEHEQNNSVPVIEITNVCNLDCPICFADNRHDYTMAVEEFERCLDILEASGSDVDVLILTGGEPTAHPKLVELVERAYRRANIPRVAIATNGILIGRKEKLVKELVRAGAYILLQLDSLDATKNQVLRGKDMHDYREAALAALESHDAQAAIIMTVIAGLNDDELGTVLEYVLHRPFIRGLEVQTMSYTGSGGSAVKFNPMTRITGTDLLHGIVEQSKGLLRMDDFVPMLHPHPNCVAITYLLALRDGGFVPFPRFTSPAAYRGAIMNSFVVQPDERHESFLSEIIDHVWANQDTIPRASEILLTLRDMLQNLYPSDREVTAAERLKVGQRYVKNIFLHNYMDAHSLDAEVLRKCTSMQIVPDGRMIPNCGYRTIHRKTDPRWQRAGAEDLGHGVDGLRSLLSGNGRRLAIVE